MRSLDRGEVPNSHCYDRMRLMAVHVGTREGASRRTVRPRPSHLLCRYPDGTCCTGWCDRKFWQDVTDSSGYVWLKQSFRSIHISSTSDCLVPCCTSGVDTVKLGGGAMGSRQRDPSVFARPDQQKSFLLAMVTAHEANLLCTRNIKDKANKIKCNTGGLTLKDLKPDTFPPVVRRILLVGRADRQKTSR